jgi:hypothetical protein
MEGNCLSACGKTCRFNAILKGHDFTARGKLLSSRNKCQGTTSVVPNSRKIGQGFSPCAQIDRAHQQLFPSQPAIPRNGFSFTNL